MKPRVKLAIRREIFTPLKHAILPAIIADESAGFLHQQDARRRALNEGNALLALQALMVTMLDAETSQRGYLLTRNPDYLQPYFTAKEHRDTALAAIEQASRNAGPLPAGQSQLRIRQRNGAG